MKFIPFLAFNNNHKCCSNQYHKKKHHAQEHKKYPGKPFSTREENPTKSFVIFFKRNNFTTKINSSTQEGASNPRTLAPKRGAHLFPKKCTC
jgi:hypothetical protein